MTKPVLADALTAPRFDFVSERAGRIAYYVDAGGEGRPLVLVHSINAAPSSFEMRPLFEQYRGQRPVYSLDLPGFGHSERGARPYTPDLYANALADFLRQVVQQPADVLALSLSAEFAARAALATPGQVASLVVISPTGFSLRPVPSMRSARITHKALTIPLVSQGLYDLVASRPSIRYFLGRSFVGDVPAEVIDYAHATSHQPGARHAPLTFLSMQLFTPNATDRLYGKLTDLPVLAIADRDPYITFERLDDFVARHPNWQRIRLAPNLGLPHWERLPETVATLDRFWSTPPAG
ncbi:alpha/beta fold hydrolase [Thiocystis violascens]|uniref:Putative hydrolase or acyltransferase of alpha/beta superfamily n=1 Tax=Thiocystis violascens (strain ATCC 17096 / DSM 198 / 6111) TaxID=765911 RepID=I3Y8L8_THIV6|nr:alpha/beta fold hydrolase [Thiocystis violascens]AFL73336.1 putative hydrolase or acyltransferase of alpha/beta superfamily [Thiocystis violascens DSM 198]